MTQEGADEGDREYLSRRRFDQTCVGVATATAGGSTLASIVGLRPPYDVPEPPPSETGISVCPVCSVGCGLLSVTSRGRPFPSRGDPKSSATSGMFCTRGSLLPAGSWPSTLSRPMRRMSPTTKGSTPTMGQFEELSWEDALQELTGKLVEFGAAFGASSRACLLGGDVPMEDAYVAGKLFKAVLDTANVDSVESLHSRASEHVMVEQLGAIGPPCSYDDISLADVIVVVGEDLATTHPVLYAHVVEAVSSRGATLVVVDPRATATSRRTRSVHVPVRAGGEVALFNSIGHALVHELEVAPSQWARANALNAAALAEYLTLYDPEYDVNERIDAVHLKDLCDGPSEWVDTLGNRDASGFLKSFDVPTITGLDPAIVRDLARRWNAAGRVLTIWSSRVAGAGDGGAAASSIVDLHLLTGQMGRPGAGVLGLHATAGGRGAVDSGATPLVLPGGFMGGTDTAPGPLAEAWGAEFAEEANRLPPGRGLVDLLRQAAQGDPYLLLLLGGSVSEQVPDRANLVEAALGRATVVSTAAHLEDPDVAWADLVLPRLSWYEREGHYVSSERRVERSLPSLAPLEGPRTELEVLADVGSRMVSGPLFASRTPLLVMDELRTAARGAPVDLSHLPLADDLTEARGVQWPVPTERSASLKGSARRHMGQDGLGPGFPTDSGKAVILPREHPGLRKATSPDYPVTAVVGIDPATWWDGRLYLPSVGNVIRHATLEPAYAEMPREDAEALGLAEGDSVLVTSAQGDIELPLRYAEEGTAPGHVFLPWGGDARTQRLVPSFPLDRDGVPPWTSFPVRVEPV